MNSILFHEGILNFLKRKTNKTFLDNRTLFTINYRNRKTKIYLNKKFGYLDGYIFEHGIYEKDVVDFIFHYLDKDKVMLDIGSNIGQHSLLLAPYCKKIYAFEPIPEVYNEFKASIAANNYENIQLQNIAVGAKRENLTIKFFHYNTGASSIIDVPTDRETSKVPIKIDKLENLIPQALKFDVVKIDVEGYEAIVLLGNVDIFLKNRPIIFVEFCPGAIDLEGSHKATDILELFLENNYEIYSREEQKWFDEFDETLNKIGNLILKPMELSRHL